MGQFPDAGAGPRLSDAVRRAEEPPAVVALLAGGADERELAAGFEEEGVPLRVGRAPGGRRLGLAREAAQRSPLGIGVGGDGGGFVLVLSAASAYPYLEARPEAARAFGHAAARVAARRPLSVESHRETSRACG